MLKCGKCKIEKAPNEFHRNKSNSTGYQKQCKDCKKSTDASFYQNNKETFKTSNVRNRVATREWFRNLKTDLKCSTCSEDDPACLDFHHLSDKTKAVAEMASKAFGKQRILSEIAKCQVLCSNCHRKHHYYSRV